MLPHIPAPRTLMNRRHFLRTSFIAGAAARVNMDVFRLCLVIAAAAWVWSGVAPADRLTWWLESGPVFVLLPILAYRHRRFALTDLSYALLAAHAVILCVGAKYTYAEVPAGHWLREALNLSRNPYDKLGHFAQGFVPAIVLRELFLRRGVLRPDAWLEPIVLGCTLGFSGLYELFEWVAALVLRQGADSFLGTQGDPWDTQSDMAFATIGGAVALFALRRVHDRQMTAGAIAAR